MEWWMWVIAYFVVGFSVATLVTYLTGKEGDYANADMVAWSWMAWPLFLIVAGFIIAWDKGLNAISPMRWFDWINEKGQETK